MSGDLQNLIGIPHLQLLPEIAQSELAEAVYLQLLTPSICLLLKIRTVLCWVICFGRELGSLLEFKRILWITRSGHAGHATNRRRSTHNLGESEV